MKAIFKISWHVAALFTALVLLGCGGGSSGTGDRVYKGLVVSDAGQGLSNVTVTIIDGSTGTILGSDLSGLDGSFEISISEVNNLGSLIINLESDTISTAVSIDNPPSDREVTITVRVNEQENRVTDVRIEARTPTLEADPAGPKPSPTPASDTPQDGRPDVQATPGGEDRTSDHRHPRPPATDPTPSPTPTPTPTVHDNSSQDRHQG